MSKKSVSAVQELGEELSAQQVVEELGLESGTAEAVQSAVAAVESQHKTFRKFAQASDEDANPYGITNSRGEIVTSAYLRRYIQCWTRQGDGFTKNRTENYAYFMSPEFLSQHVGKTASQIGKIASTDARWGKVAKTVAAPTDETPIAVDLSVLESAAA